MNDISRQGWHIQIPQFKQNKIFSILSVDKHISQCSILSQISFTSLTLTKNNSFKDIILFSPQSHTKNNNKLKEKLSIKGNISGIFFWQNGHK